VLTTGAYDDTPDTENAAENPAHIRRKMKDSQRRQAVANEKNFWVTVQPSEVNEAML